eukprot:TRINITY_DN8630_c0_g1_i1.p1 TRINITY_DN8630_c0_g1~~TRINITY_DN8630_c0_g1_i1.p1  ORF type:complete len:245 (-),score=49.54 TRINITY_DN8630_c0_g1_i1:159-893(-)
MSHQITKDRIRLMEERCKHLLSSVDSLQTSLSDAKTELHQKKQIAERLQQRIDKHKGRRRRLTRTREQQSDSATDEIHEDLFADYIQSEQVLHALRDLRSQFLRLEALKAEKIRSLMRSDAKSLVLCHESQHVSSHSHSWASVTLEIESLCDADIGRSDCLVFNSHRLYADNASPTQSSTREYIRFSTRHHKTQVQITIGDDFRVVTEPFVGIREELTVSSPLDDWIRTQIWTHISSQLESTKE